MSRSTRLGDTPTIARRTAICRSGDGSGRCPDSDAWRYYKSSPRSMPTSTTTSTSNATSLIARPSKSAAQRRWPSGVRSPPNPRISKTDLHRGDTSSHPTDTTYRSRLDCRCFRWFLSWTADRRWAGRIRSFWYTLGCSGDCGPPRSAGKESRRHPHLTIGFSISHPFRGRHFKNPKVDCRCAGLQKGREFLSVGV
jgi:hypothetical protein